MKILIIATILIIGLVWATEQEKLNGFVDLIMQEETAVKKHNQQEYSQWKSGLFDEILDSPNPNIRIFGIRHLIYPIKKDSLVSTLTNKLDTHKLDDFIQNIIENDSIGPQALLMLSAFCNSERIEYQCDNQLLSQKLIELEPYNIRSYISLLDTAVKLQNPSEINDALSMLAKAQYINNHFNAQTEFTQLVKDYIQDYPAPQSHIEQNLNVFGLTELKQYTQKELNDHLLFSTMVGFEMAIPSDNYYRLIKQACEDNLSSVQDCLIISNTLINNSYTVLSKWLGYDLQLSIHENSNDLNKFKSIKDQKTQFNHAYSCLGKSITPFINTGFLVTKNFHQITSKIGAEKGEFARLTKMAELIYKNQTSKGNHEVINPDSCFVS